MARDVMTVVPQILPVTAADMQIAGTLFRHYAPRGMRARDAIHAAIMQNHGLTHIISPATFPHSGDGLTRQSDDRAI
jgi:predicted nucleic acid-binding protein